MNPLFGVLHQAVYHLQDIGFINVAIAVINVVERVVVVAVRHINQVEHTDIIAGFFSSRPQERSSSPFGSVTTYDVLSCMMFGLT